MSMYLVNDIVEPSDYEINPTKASDVSWVLVTPTLRKREVNEGEELDMLRGEILDLPLEEESNETVLYKREIIKPEQQPPVQVHIQNISESTGTGSVQIVYVVLVGGRAVPAAVAARDMRLVRDAEVAKELGAIVTTKAEPYLKAAEGLEGEATTAGVHGTELWALAVGATIAILLLVILFVLLCLAHRKKCEKSAASLREYRSELMREIERNKIKQEQESKNGKQLISVVSPSRTRPSSALLPIYRKDSCSGSSTSSSVSEIAVALRRRHNKPHALRMPQKKRVGTTDSLLEAAGVESSDSSRQASAPQTPTSYLSMPSVATFPRGNIVEPLSRILEPVSVRHLDIDSPISSPKHSKPSHHKDTIPRRQMPSQLVRLGSIDKDPGVIGPLVWDLHCQRIKDASKPSTPVSGSKEAGPSRMRQRFNELMDDAFTLFGSAGSATDAGTLSRETSQEKNIDPTSTIAQARNENVRLSHTPARGQSAGTGRSNMATESRVRPRTTFTRTSEARAPPPTSAWGPTSPHSSTIRTASKVPVVNMTLLTTEGKLPPEDPAIPLISAIKSEIQRVRENALRHNNN
ncbi:uncharacterized protein LOC126978116 [Leptidea sinapis]|uniref:uncharacterized protein LOC126978116 n=1 Tax=Leptidea sinapis TaxID=189913 RepID=UPI0021C2EA5E|nr:uncharacterized protein LOC126978116 [Leptidea sinapis]